MQGITAALVALLIVLGSVCPVHARRPSPYVVIRVEGSLSHRTGNTDKLTYSYGLTVTRELRRHLLFAALRGEWSNNEGQPADIDNVRADLMETWRLHRDVEPYAKLTYYENEPWGFRRQVRAGVGVVQGWWQGRRGPAFRTRVGYQFRANHFTDVWSRSTGPRPRRRQHCALMGVRAQLSLMRNIGFAVSGDYEPVLREADNYYAELNGSLTFEVNRRVSLVATQDVTYQRIPVPGKERRNTDLGMRLAVHL